MQHASKVGGPLQLFTLYNLHRAAGVLSKDSKQHKLASSHIPCRESPNKKIKEPKKVDRNSNNQLRNKYALTLPEVKIVKCLEWTVLDQKKIDV